MLHTAPLLTGYSQSFLFFLMKKNSIFSQGDFKYPKSALTAKFSIAIHARLLRAQHLHNKLACPALTYAGLALIDFGSCLHKTERMAL